MDMTKKLTKDLIEMYWERKCLWQVNSREYKKRDMKKKAYQEIVMFLRKNGVKEANAKLVRDKIQNLRRAMRKEKKRIDASGGAHSPTLWYYDLLMFVNDQYEDTAPLSGTSKLFDDKCDSDGICSDDEDSYHSIDKKPFETEKRSQALQPTEAPNVKVEYEKPIESTDKTKDAAEFEAVGINFTAKLKRMESKQQIFAELLIQKVLARGLLGELNETTDIVDRV